MNHDALKEELIATDEEFRSLYEEHQDCESKLEALLAQGSLSQEDEIEAKRIKVHKLALKDRMEVLIRQHASEVHA